MAPGGSLSVSPTSPPPGNPDVLFPPPAPGALNETSDHLHFAFMLRWFRNSMGPFVSDGPHLHFMLRLAQEQYGPLFVGPARAVAPGGYSRNPDTNVGIP